MQKFIIKFTYFLLPVLIPLVILELAFRTIPNDFKIKSDFMNQNSEKIETLIIGSSHSHLGLNPIYFEDYTYNLSMIGENIEFSNLVFNRHKKQLTNLKKLIIPVSYHSLTNDKMRVSRIKDYSIYYDFKISDIPSHNFEILNLEIFKGYEELKNYYYLNDYFTRVKSDSTGWAKRMDPDIYDFRAHAMRIAKNHTKSNQEAVLLNINRLREIISFCKINNIKVVLFTPPHEKNYLKFIDLNQYSTVISTCEKLESDYENVRYTNFNDYPDFKTYDFMDSNHLNAKGTAKLSVLVNKL